MHNFKGLAKWLGRPLPGWLTLALVLGGTALAAGPTYYGSLSVISGGHVTDANASGTGCVSTDVANKFVYNGVCARKDVDNNFTASQSIQVTGSASQLTLTQSNVAYAAQLNITGSQVGGGNNDVIKFDTTSTTGGVNAIGTVNFDDTGYLTGAHGSRAVKIWAGIAGATAHDKGGYVVFCNKLDGGASCTESEVWTADAHIYPAGPSIGTSTAGCIGTDTQGVCQITTPGACSAGTVCGSVTVAFGRQFLQPDGTTAEQPYCFFTVQDTNTVTRAWVTFPEAISSTQFKLDYQPVSNSAQSTLNLYWLCNASVY